MNRRWVVIGKGDAVRVRDLPGPKPNASTNSVYAPMFLFRKPSPERIRRFMADQRQASLTYAEVGASRADEPPPGYGANRGRIVVGSGEATYMHATEALRRWAHYDMKWVRIIPPAPPLEVGQTVGLRVHHFGFWSLNACRIVYTFDEEDAAGRRFGFGYGTLPEHGERGEERFEVAWNRVSDDVSYELFSFARPGPLLARLGFPFVRMLQKKFARDSVRAMAKAARRE